MRRLRPLLPFLSLLLLALIAAEPLARAGMVCADDVAFHLYRAVQLGALMDLGHLFPRWAPHMAQGYGFPFFNFYAPLSSYVVVLLRHLGLEYPAALKLAFGLAIWGAGSAAFVFTRRLWGERAGLAAGAAYLFAPYLAYDALFRANLAETFAFVWPPLVLWGIQGAVDSEQWAAGRPLRNVVRRWSPAVSYAALILTHNIFALIASPLFAGYLALLAWRSRSGQVLRRGGLALALGIGLSAYFWLPALAERDLVHSDRLLVPPIFTWYTNFITPGELLAPPRAEDPSLLNPSPPRALGLVPAALTLPALGLALASAWRRRKRAPASASSPQSFTAPGAWPVGLGAWGLGFFALALLAYGFMTLPASAPVWRLLPPLELVQFPWRLLGPAALCAAVLIGASVAALERALPARFTLAPAPVVIVLIAAANLSWWYPRYCAPQAQATLADMLAFEQASGTLGTTAKGEYLPRAVAAMPADETLAQAIRRGEEPVRLQVAVGEADLTVRDARDPLDAAFTVEAGTTATLVYRQFLYPGWRVLVDGAPATLTPTPATGLIQFTLPPGEHAVRVVFGATPLRAVAVAISLMCLVVLVVGFVVSGRKSAGRGQQAVGRHSSPRVLENWDLLLLSALLLALKLGAIDRFPNPLRRPAFDGQTVARARTPLRVDFAGGLSLYGFDLEARTLPADGGVDAALYVSMRAPALRTFWPAFWVQDAAGRLWNDTNAALPPRWHREPPFTYDWPPEKYAQWARRLTLLPGAPPGEYALWVSVFDRATFETMSALDPAGNPVAPRVSLGTLTVARPAQPWALEPETPAPFDFGPLTFLGYGLDRTALKAGDTLAFTGDWRADETPGRDYAARLQLLDAEGRAVFAVDLAPVDGYTTSRWLAGDQWRGQHRVVIPADLPDGVYRLAVSVAGLPGLHPLGVLPVEAPERVFAPPSFETTGGAQFAGVGELAGYSLRRDGRTLTLTLVWRASATPPRGYTVFVHLGDAARVWAQSDSVPAGGARPTTGWLAGEYVTDAHTLTLPDDLPPGDYALFVGLYDPLTSERVAVAGPGAGADGRAQILTLTLP